MRAADLARDSGSRTRRSGGGLRSTGRWTGVPSSETAAQRSTRITGSRSPAKGREGIVAGEKRVLAVKRELVNGEARKTREEAKQDALKPSNPTTAGGGCVYRSAATPHATQSEMLPEEACFSVQETLTSPIALSKTIQDFHRSPMC